MSVVNRNEINRLIRWHENQIKGLRAIVTAANSIGSTPPSLAEALTKPAGKKKSVAKTAPEPAPKRKRGAVTAAVKKLLKDANGKALTSGHIRTTLQQKKVITKKNSTIYTMLQQLAKRGVIGKTKDGYTYKAD